MAKKAASAKIKKVDEEIDIVQELKDKISKMEADRDAKCASAKEQLVEMLKVTADKYKTATGTAEALRVIRFVYGEQYENAIYVANRMARRMAHITEGMTEKAEKLDYADMDQLCDGFYEKHFDIPENELWDDASYHLCVEMMKIDLCRNVGGAAEDMVAFINRIGEEIEATKKALDEAEAK